MRDIDWVCVTPLMVIVITVGLIIGIAGNATAGADYTDDCNEDTDALQPGTHSESTSPGDRDNFRVAGMEEGDYIVVRLDSNGPLLINGHTGEISITALDGGNPESIPNRESGFSSSIHLNPGESEFRIYLEEQNECIQFRTWNDSAAEWRMAFQLNQDTIPGFSVSNMTANVSGEIFALQQELADLEQRADTLDERIKEISARIDELQGQLNATAGNETGAVTGNATGSDAGSVVEGGNQTHTTTTSAQASARVVINE